jgi:hypothetical protein
MLSCGNHYLIEAHGSDHPHCFLMASAIVMPMAFGPAQSMELQITWVWDYGASSVLLKDRIAKLVELGDPKV